MLKFFKRFAKPADPMEVARMEVANPQIHGADQMPDPEDQEIALEGYEWLALFVQHNTAALAEFERIMLECNHRLTMSQFPLAVSRIKNAAEQSTQKFSSFEVPAIAHKHPFTL